MKETSEFGKGFIYNLVLFAKHWGNLKEYRFSGNEPDYGLWFNGAGDHFFDFEVPAKWKETELGGRFEALRSLILDFRLKYSDSVTKADFEGVFKDLEELCILIDKELGVEDIKATWN